MKSESQDYSLFFEFIDTFSPIGFKGIDPDHPLMLELEEMMEKNNQFFYIADILQMRVLLTSRRSKQMIGIEPSDLSPYHFMEATHPDDLQRLNLGRAKVIKMAQDIFIKGKGPTIVSTNYKMRIPDGSFSDFLIQGYLKYLPDPHNTVFFLKIHTNIDWTKKIKSGYHYYVGDDLSYLRYPDDALLQMGNVFTKREFEIIRLIEQGLSTEQIAEKLFVSPYTVNTHRGNILQKTNKTNISDLIYDLKERGLL
jgi:DNA-binding CsgD family transcriptional regulator